MKGLFANKSAFTQLIILVFLTLISSLIASFLALLLVMGTGGEGLDLTQSPDKLRWIQLISALGTFLFPALGMGFLCSTDLRRYLSLGKMPEGKIFLYLLLAYFLMSPVMNLTQCLNQQMALPEFMEPIENWMKEREDAAEKLTLTLLSENDLLSILFNLLVVAVAAGITEEFFFRGALQRVFERWGLNPHAVIWISAILFSAFHLQFYGFIPRMLLGAYFGYLLYWGRNIWVPVIAHTLNNTVAVLGMSNARLKEMEYFNGEFGTEYILPLTILAVVSLPFLFLLLRRMKKVLDTD